MDTCARANPTRGRLLVGLTCLVFAVSARPLRASDAWANRILPFLQEHCLDCHGAEKPKAGLDLSAYGPTSPIRKERKQWLEVLEMLRRSRMPPKKAPQPPQDDRQAVAQALDDALAALDCSGEQDPGRVTLRRLNRTEYNNVVADLFGVDFKPARDFPADDIGYGFDNIGDVLSLSPVLFDKYLAAAEKIADQVTMHQGKGVPTKPPSEFLTCRLRDDEDWRPSARQFLEPLARRAFRRPLRDGELENLIKLVEVARADGASFERGVRLAVQAILVSPYFLFHVVEAPPVESTDAVLPLNDFELAARLAFFLWSRLPDDELVHLAEAGKLRDETILEQQVRRLLADDRASALAENFAAQWLQLRRLDTVAPDPDRFPDYDDDLRRASRRETELFFNTVVRDDLSVLTLLDADFSFVNDRLARHYGIAGVEGSAFQRVRFENGRRGGIVSHASMLTITSNPTRTSPVKRGKWILGEILGSPPPPPPPGVEDLDEEDEAVQAASLRERFERHRADPVCASCHQSMDPLGFALENYDAIGAWRDRDGKFPINAAGNLPDGAFFDGPADLKKVLLERKRDFVRCLSEKLLTYGLGRGIEYHDDCALEGIVNATEADGYRFSRLVLEVVRSVPFRMKRGRMAGDQTHGE